MTFDELEERARRGEPMPEGLRLYEQHAYQALTLLYSRYFRKEIPREQASLEKKQIKRQLELAYKDDNFRDNLCYHHEKLLRMTEATKTLCRKEPTPENVIRLCDVLDGLDTNDVLRPVLQEEHGSRCPVCEKFFEPDHAARQPNYCESCGTRLGWLPGEREGAKYG